MNVKLTDVFSNRDGKYEAPASVTDKHRAPRRPHSYGPVYDLIFTSQIGILKRPLSVMEIGTHRGGSAAGFLQLDEWSLKKFVCLDVDNKQDQRCAEIMNNDKILETSFLK